MQLCNHLKSIIIGGFDALSKTDEREEEEGRCDELHLCQCFESCLLLQSVDWWSLGILMFELLTGASPFTLEGERNSQSEVSK